MISVSFTAIPQFPIKAAAYGLNDARRSFFECGRLGQDAGNAVFRGETAFRDLAFGNVVMGADVMADHAIVPRHG